MNKSNFFYRVQQAIRTLVVLSLAMAIGLWGIEPISAQSLAPTPTVLNMPFDDCTTTDVSQTANHGTLLNGNGDECIDSPVAGKAFKFDGVDEYVALTNKIQGYPDFTMSVWFRDDDLSYVTSPFEAYSTVIQTGLGYISLMPNVLCGEQSEKGCIAFAVFPNRDGRSVPTERAYYGKVPDAFSVGEWHHAVLTADGSNEVKAYIDGEFAINIPLALIGIHQMSSYNYANLGAVEYTYYTGFYRAYYLNGAIDEVKIYSTVLTADEIRGLYAAGLNTAPTANTGGPYLGAVSTDIIFDGSGSSDPEGNPLTETWTADGGTVTNSVFTAGDVPGIYDVCLIVNDGSLNSEINCTYVVVYDPEGGFVTGSGWINSTEGSYTPNPNLTGKATFGFVSKYKKGANEPIGNTEFQFKVADLNFKSTSYDWLVVAGSKAKFKGTGTINGNGEYGFMLSAIDGSPDMFRIKIWDKVTDEVVYDNQLGADDTTDPSTVIQGGSIVIHKAK